MPRVKRKYVSVHPSCTHARVAYPVKRNGLKTTNINELAFLSFHFFGKLGWCGRVEWSGVKGNRYTVRSLHLMFARAAVLS